MDDERQCIVGNGRNNGFYELTRNDVFNRRESIWCWVQNVFVIDIEFGEHGHPVDEVLTLALNANLFPDKIAQFEKAHLGFWIAGCTPIGQQSADGLISLRERATRAGKLHTR